MRFGILGPLEVTSRGRHRSIGGGKRTLLAALLVQANEPVSSDRLVEVLWPGAAPDDPSNALQSQVTRLRRIVDEGSSPGSGAGQQDRRLANTGTGYVLRVGPEELDALEFESLSSEVERAISAGNWHAAVERADQALACWRGPALEGFSEAAFARSRAEQLEQRRLGTTEQRIEAKLELGLHREVVVELGELVDQHPFRESFWQRYLLALYRSGRQADALRAYRDVERTLREELGVDPGPELARLEHQILTHDEALDGPGSPPGRIDTGDRPGRVQPETTSQVVTFLFTDVERSTARWEIDPEGMDVSLRTHDRALQETVEDHRGRMFGGRPIDGFCVVFERPGDAVEAALDGQRRLQAVYRDEHDPLRVRMAIHTGVAQAREGNYFGHTVNQVARMRDAGHGGQILVSAASRELLGEDVPARAELVSIGPWLFEGFSRPERVYQLTHPDLPGGFPPLRSARPPTGTIPRHATSFLGRHDDFERVLEALGPGRLLTLTGEGGIGKTRLALELAHRVRLADYPDGVWFCDLSTIDDSNGLVEHLVNALQLPGASGTDLRHALLASLHGSRRLLILDSCEHLRSAVAELAGEIVASSADTTVLATSRARLRSPGEQRIKLEPLALPDDDATDPHEAPAVQLLIDRARAAGAPLDEHDTSLVGIARSLEGLPLAIELAAPRLTTLSPGELADRLGPSSELLTGPNHLPMRQRTLRATIHGSFQLLDDRAQDLFGALSVFRGGWSLATAEAVAAGAGLDPEAVAPLMAELVDHSMIQVDLAGRSTARYTMLDSMHAYAADQLVEAGRQPSVAARHAAHFIDLAEAAVDHRRGPLEPAWVKAIGDEFDNLRAAYRWSITAGRPLDTLRLVVALADDAMMRERLEVGRWAEEVANLPAITGEPLQGAALALAGSTAMLEGRFDDAIRLSDRALAADQEAHSTQSWIAHNTLAMLSVVGSADSDWYEHLRAMERLSQESGDPLAAALADYDRALLASLTEWPDVGRPAAESLLELAREHANPTLMAMGLLSCGRVVAAAEPDLAAHHYREALAAATSAHNTLLVQQLLRASSAVDARRDPATALASLRSVTQRFEWSGNIAGQLETIVTMLEPLVALEALEEAATLCAGLADTPAPLTAAWRLVDHAVAERLPPDRLVDAHRTGTAMSPEELVRFASEVVTSLVGDPSG